jgi:hypothetical protein
MKSLAILVPVLALAAACNTSREGANGSLSFTPENCGVAAGCDFDMSVGVGGKINVTLDSLDGTSTAGVDLASRDESLMTVVPGEDLHGEPSWEVTALGAGVADLVALDANGGEIDFVEVPMQDVIGVTMQPYVGDIVGPTTEAGYDESFQVNAGESVSWFIRPLIAGDVETMGRFDVETTENQGDPDPLQYEEANSDRPNGYFYVTLPSGDWPIEFDLSYDPSNLYDTAIIHAVAP